VLIVDLEIVPDVERIPDRGVLGAEAVKRETARLLFAHFAQLV